MAALDLMIKNISTENLQLPDLQITPTQKIGGIDVQMLAPNESTSLTALNFWPQIFGSRDLYKAIQDNRAVFRIGLQDLTSQESIDMFESGGTMIPPPIGS